VRHEFSYKLLHTTIARRTAARILLQDLCKYFNGYKPSVNEQIKFRLCNHATRLQGGMEIILHAAILSNRYNEENSEVMTKVNRILMDWITSLVSEDAINAIQEPISSNSLKSKVWTLHPWLLARLSLIHQPFFEIYSKVLIRCTRQEQQYMMGNLSIESIHPRLFYQLPSEMLLYSQVNQRWEGLLIHWELLRYQFGNYKEVINHLLQQEWITFKSKYIQCWEQKTMFGQIWNEFFLRLGMNYNEE
ncbi:12445_t:CDS:2, partial [Acaulospora morrowiae]